MPDYDFRTMLFSHRAEVGYDMESLSQLKTRGPQMILHDTDLQLLPGAANGYAVRTQGPNACVQIPALQVTDEQDTNFLAIGFRVYVPDVSADEYICFLNLGSPDNIVDGATDEGMYLFYYTPSAADPGLGWDGLEFGFRLFGINAIDSNNTHVRMSSSPVLTAGWHDIILQFGQLPDLTDARLWLDGTLYSFDVSSGSLSNWVTGTRDGYLGINTNTQRYTGVLEAYFDNVWLTWEPQFWTGQSTTFTASQVQKIRDSQYIVANTPPSATPMPYVFDTDRSGPMDASLATWFAADEIRLVSSPSRQWVTAVVKQSIPLGTGKYTCTFQITNDVGWGPSDWAEMWENVAAGVIGDQTYSVVPAGYTGSFGPHVGTVLPGLGIWMKGGAGQPYLYRRDFTNEASGDESSSVPASSNQVIEVVFDSGTKQVDVYVGGGCSPMLAASYVVDFEDQYARFAVSIRRPLTPPTEPGVKVLSVESNCDVDAKLPQDQQTMGVRMRLPTDVPCSSAQRWVDILAALEHSYLNDTSGLGSSNVQGAIDELAISVRNHLSNPNPHGRVRWIGKWPGGTAERFDQTFKDGWLMIANKRTTEDPKPQAGQEGWVTDSFGAPTYVSQTIAEGVWIMGQEYYWEAGAVLNAVKMVFPPNSENFQYSVWIRTNRGEFDEALVQLVAPIAGSVAQSEYEFGVGAQIYPPDTLIEAFLVAQAVTQSNTFNAQWDVKNTNGNPSEGEANFQSNNTEIRIHKTDKDDVDQTANLEAVEVGGTLSFGGSTWTITVVDIRGSHVRYHLTPNQGRPSENTYTLTFTWGSADPIPYLVDQDYWAPFVNVNVRGFEGDKLGTLIYNSNQYGIDLYITEVKMPQDWDLQAFSG